MPVSEAILKERFKAPEKKTALKRAQVHDDRVMLHTQLYIHRNRAPAAFNDFMTFVEGLLPSDKARIFKLLCRFPLPTVEETTRAYSALGKVWDGQNIVVSVETARPEIAADWHKYRDNELKLEEFWRQDAWEAIVSAINSFVVVDMPAEQVGKYPSPYPYLVHCSGVIDYQESRRRDIEWVMFRESDETVIVIDDASYRRFKAPKRVHIGDFSGAGTAEPEFALLEEKPHDLGRCPVAHLWNQVISAAEPGIHRSEVTPYLADLDWMLYYLIAKRHLDTYAGYPIYSSFDADCDYELENEQGEYLRCDSGFLRDQNNRYLTLADGALAPCPVCNKRDLTGPGSHVKISRPSPDNQMADLRNPVQITTIDRQSLDYNVAESTRLKHEFYVAVTGYGSEPITDQAVNEKQVMSAYESRTAKLREFKRPLEAIINWVDLTIGQLRYGKEAFISCHRDMGTDFFLYDAHTILNVYTQGRKDQWDTSVLDHLFTQYINTQYRNNPEQIERHMIISNLTPYRHITPKQAQELTAAGMMSRRDLTLILNISNFVKRFEVEQGPLTRFGALLPLDRRIAAIRETLYEYADEIEKTLPSTSTKAESAEKDEGDEEE